MEGNIVLDQSFSAQNLFYIYKNENNKGNNIASKFFPEIIDSHDKIKRLRKIISSHYKQRRKRSDAWFKTRVSNLYLLLKILKKNRNELITQKLSDVSSRISSKSFNFEVMKSNSKRNDKDVYLLDRSPESFFAEKQIQRNIKYTYKVKQNDRDLIIPQLSSCLNNKFPVHIIRTDIKSFYESIDPSILLKKLNENAILSLSSRKIIAKLLRSYKASSSSDTGIPRGVGISAYLSELYLKEFDSKLRNLDNLVYYARYVDDIVLIVAPEVTVSKEHYLDLIKNYLNEVNLDINTDQDKTAVFVTPTVNDTFEFDYLGYKFKKRGNKLLLSISDKKKEKYVSKINYCVDKYNKSSEKAPKKAEKELKIRLRFLTSNTRLSNNKGNAVIGIFNNNKWVTDYNFLNYLDGQLKQAISKVDHLLLQPKLRDRYSFKKGFENRNFSNFDSKDFSVIGRGWEI
jgi:hypothetical protein